MVTAGDDGQRRERKEEREEEQVREELTLDCVSALGDGGKERTMRMASSTATGRRGRIRGGRRRLARPRPDSLGAEGDKDAGMTSTGAISSGQTRVTAMRRRAAAAGVGRGRGTARGTREQGGGKRQARSSASWACVLDQQGGHGVALACVATAAERHGRQGADPVDTVEGGMILLQNRPWLI